jgi:hypothetical protein
MVAILREHNSLALDVAPRHTVIGGAITVLLRPLPDDELFR